MADFINRVNNRYKLEAIPLRKVAFVEAPLFYLNRALAFSGFHFRSPQTQRKSTQYTSKPAENFLPYAFHPDHILQAIIKHHFSMQASCRNCFQYGSDEVCLIDLMPPTDKHSNIVRTLQVNLPALYCRRIALTLALGTIFQYPLSRVQ
jgi:hypothetical protein